MENTESNAQFHIPQASNSTNGQSRYYPAYISINPLRIVLLSMDEILVGLRRYDYVRQNGIKPCVQQDASFQQFLASQYQQQLNGACVQASPIAGLQPQPQLQQQQVQQQQQIQIQPQIQPQPQQQAQFNSKLNNKLS